MAKLFTYFLLLTFLACGSRIAAEVPKELQDSVDRLCDVVGSVDAQARIHDWPDRSQVVDSLASTIMNDRAVAESCRGLVLRLLLDEGRKDQRGRAEIEYPAQMLALEHSLSDSNPRIRFLAADSLPRVSAQFRGRAEIALLNSLADSDEKVVAVSASSLWEIADEDEAGARKVLLLLRTQGELPEFGKEAKSIGESLALAYAKLNGGFGELPELQLVNDPKDSITRALCIVSNNPALLANSAPERKIAAARRLSLSALNSSAGDYNRYLALRAIVAIADSAPQDTELGRLLDSTIEAIRSEPVSADAGYELGYLGRVADTVAARRVLSKSEMVAPSP